MIMNLADFHFIRPYWFIALLPVILFIILSFRNKLARGNWSEVCDDALLPFILQDSDKTAERHWSLIAISVASLLAIIALAGPTWERLPTPAFHNDAALVIALDLSRSMNANDIKPSRLIRARYKIADILQQRKDGLTALIAYAGDAFVVTPLTSDTATITNQLNALTTEIMPSQGSNTLAALKQAVELLQQGGQQEGSILLIADDINIGSMEQAEAILGNYTLSILGIGTAEGAPIKLKNGGFLKDAQGNLVVPRLITSRLASLAQHGGGIYQTISIDESDIDMLMANNYSAHTQKTIEDSEHFVEQWVEQGPWLLLFLLPLTAFYFRKGLLVIPLLVLMNYPQDSYAFGWQDLWQTSDQQAQQAFDKQQYKQAADQFKTPEWQAAAQYKAEEYQQAAETLQPIEQHTAESYYNQATALAKADLLKPALDVYEKALQLDPEHEDAIYNKKLVEEALENQQQEQGQDGEPSDDQTNEDQQQQNDQTEQEPDDENEQNNQSQKNDSEQDETTQQSEQEDDDDSEQKQAQEQWLNRIVDDPAGLLKRKFKYQYNRRQQSEQQEQLW